MTVLRHPGVGREEFARDQTLIPGACYRGPFEAYRRALAGSTEASDNYHFATYALATGLVAGRRAYVEHGRPTYPNTFVALVGDTGRARKSTAIRFGRDILDGLGVEPLTTSSWEALVDLLAERDGRGVLMLPGEYRTLAAKARQDGLGNLIPGLTELFDCPPVIRHKTRDRDAKAERPFLAILTSSTADWLQGALTDSDVAGGFANRWVFVDGQPKPPNPFPSAPDPDHWRTAREALEALDDRLRFVPEGVGLRVDMSTEARDAWARFYAETLDWKHANDTLARLAERVQDTVIKLALMYALLEESDEILRDQLVAAICFGRWQRLALGRVFDGFGENARVRLERRVRESLSSDWQPFSALHRRIGGRYDSDTLRRVVESLARVGAAESKASGRGLLVRLTNVDGSSSTQFGA